MARPLKIGLDYFPFDIDFFQDIKIRKLIKEKKIEALPVYMIMLCKIYKDGYFISCNSDLIFDVSEYLKCSEDFVTEVLGCCLNLGLFNKVFYDENMILTSKGIQIRYKQICDDSKRKHCKISKYNLVNSEETGINSEKTLVNSEETGIKEKKTIVNSEFSTHSKVKESKVKESKHNSINSELIKSNLFRKPDIPIFDEVLRVFIQNGGSEKMAKTFFDRNESTGWFYKGSPITNYTNLIPSYIDTWKSNDNKNGRSYDKGFIEVPDDIDYDNMKL